MTASFELSLILASKSGLLLEDVTSPDHELEPLRLAVAAAVQGILDGQEGWSADQYPGFGGATILERVEAWRAILADAHALAIGELEGGDDFGPLAIKESQWSKQIKDWEPIEGATGLITRSDDPQPVAADSVGIELPVDGHHLALTVPRAEAAAEATCRWIVDDVEPRSEGVVLYFHRTRTRILDATGEVAGTPFGAEHGNTSALQGDDWTSVWIRWGTPLLANELGVSLRFLGDPPLLRGRTWLLAGAPPAAPAEAPLSVPPHVADPKDRKVLGTYVATLEAEWAERAARVEADPDPAPHKLFFTAFDRASHPQSGGASSETLLALGNYLRVRYLSRAEHAHLGRDFTLPPEETAYWGPGVRAAGGLLLDTLAEHYTDKVGEPLPLGLIGAGFLAFSTGELAVFGHHGVPNGVNILSFVELCDLALEVEFEESVFRALRAHYATGCHAFALSYHACDGPRTQCSYRIENNPKGERELPEDMAEQIAARYSGPDIMARYTELVHAMLYDDLPPMDGATTPIPLRDVGCE